MGKTQSNPRSIWPGCLLTCCMVITSNKQQIYSCFSLTLGRDGRWRGSKFSGEGVRWNGAAEGGAPVGGPGASSPGNFLRATDSKYGESNDSSENSVFLLLYQNDPFGELFSEI